MIAKNSTLNIQYLCSSFKYYFFFADLRSVKGLINGIRARIGELPYMVGIMQDGTIICGGALISDRHVLTNAHCVIDRSVVGKATYTDLEVCVGTVNRDDFSTGEIIQIDKISPHPDFEQTIDSMANYDDIAVITVSIILSVDFFSSRSSKFICQLMFKISIRHFIGSHSLRAQSRYRSR